MWRLLLTVGLAGAGLCLVLAMIVLVVTLGGGSSRTHPPPVASTGHHRYRTTIVYEPRPVAGNGSASTVRYALGLLVAQFHGTGPVTGDRFRITRPGDWGISWQFSCTQGHPGNLTVRANDVATDRARIAGKSNGHGEGYGRNLGHGKTKGHKKHKAKKHKAKKHKNKKHKKKHKAGKHKAKKARSAGKHGGPGKATSGQPGHAHQPPSGNPPAAGSPPGSGNQNSRVALSATGYSGRGMSWYTSDPGEHALDVSSSCSWVIKIVLPKP